MPGTDVNLRVFGDCQIGRVTVSLDSPRETIVSQTFNLKFDFVVVETTSYMTVYDFSASPIPLSRCRKLKLFNKDSMNAVYVALASSYGIFVFLLRPGSTFMLDSGDVGEAFHADDDDVPEDPMSDESLRSIRAKAEDGTPTLEVFLSQT